MLVSATPPLVDAVKFSGIDAGDGFRKGNGELVTARIIRCAADTVDRRHGRSERTGGERNVKLSLTPLNGDAIAVDERSGVEMHGILRVAGQRDRRIDRPGGAEPVTSLLVTAIVSTIELSGL